jgi:Na+/H+ antiporter NhaA
MENLLIIGIIIFGFILGWNIGIILYCVLSTKLKNIGGEGKWIY